MLKERKWKISRFLAFVMVFALTCSHLLAGVSYGAPEEEAVITETGDASAEAGNIAAEAGNAEAEADDAAAKTSDAAAKTGNIAAESDDAAVSLDGEGEIIIIDEPEFIKVYEPPAVLPDPNEPDSPSRAATLKDGKFTIFIRIYNPEIGEYQYIPESGVPFDELPKTGDGCCEGFWEILGLMSACGALLCLRRRAM